MRQRVQRAPCTASLFCRALLTNTGSCRSALALQQSDQLFKH